MNELIKIGFNRENKSTINLVKATYVAINNKNIDRNIMKNIFLEIEKEDCVKYEDIISNIQKSIDLLWLKSNQQQLRTILNIHTQNKPTVKSILYYLINIFE